jgi:hypothetical protein
MGGVWETSGVHTGFWWGNPIVRANMEDLGINGSLLAKWIIKKWNRATWTGLLWLRIRTGCGSL